MLPPGTTDRARLSAAYFAGLLPYVLGVTPVLRAVSLGASAYLTHRGLVGTGVTPGDAGRSVAWSFGGQVGVIAAGWAMRALVALVAGI
jgi:hypothetical protein